MVLAGILEKHENFINKHHLNFDLLVDDEFKLSKAVGIYRLKKSFGKIWE